MEKEEADQKDIQTLKENEPAAVKDPAVEAMMKEMRKQERLRKKIIKAKEQKFNLPYTKCEKDPEYASYCLFAQCESYSEYRHKASFYDLPLVKRDKLFSWYRMFFEAKTDCILTQENAPSREGYAKNVPQESSIWTKKELKILRDYVLSWKNEYTQKSKAKAKEPAGN